MKPPNRFIAWFLVPLILILGGAVSVTGPIISGAATTILSQNLSTNRALVSTSGGKVGVSALTTIELERLIGVSSGVQSQFNTLTSATAAKLSLNGGTMTGALTLAADPAGPYEPVTLQYLQAQLQGLNPKQVVKVATTANITLSGNQTIDGVLTTTGDRVLVKNQSTSSQNGIYITGSGAWQRALDVDTWGELPAAYVFVEQGSANADVGYVCTSNTGGTLGSTAVTWVQFTAAGSYSADGSGIELSGTQFALELDGATLSKSGNGLKINGASQAEISYLAGVTSAIQTQLDGKAASSHSHTITLTGDVGASGASSGSISTTIAPDAVTYAKLQNVGANSIVGRAAGTSGDAADIAIGSSQLFGRAASGDLTPISLGTNLSLTGSTLNAAGGGVSPAHLRYTGCNGRGSTKTTVDRFVTAAPENSGGSDLTATDSSTLGFYYTVNTSGVYAVSINLYQVSGASTIYLGVGSNVVDISTNLESEIRGSKTHGSGATEPLPWTGYIASGQKVWSSSYQPPSNSYPYLCQFTIARVN